MSFQESETHFYDARGLKALSSLETNAFYLGIPQHLNAPYYYAYSRIAQRTSGKVLDVGCGTGVHSVEIAKLGHSVLGIDFSPESIKAAEAYSQKLGTHSLTEFKIMRAEEVDALRKQFDILFFSGSLYYLSPKTINELIESSLRPEGIIIAIETVGDNIILNFYRRIKNLLFRHRDSRTLTSLLKIRDFSEISPLLQLQEIRYFDLLTLLSRLIPGEKFRKSYSDWAKKIDRLILNHTILKHLSFKIVYIGKKVLQ